MSRPTFPRFPKASRAARLPTRGRWKSSSGTRSRTAFSPANTKPISSNILRAASSRLPAFRSEPSGPASDPRAVEIEFWDSIKNSILASEYEAYLEQYPEGGFVALARVPIGAERPGFRPAGGGNRVLGLDQEQHSRQRIRSLSRAIS